MRMRHIAQVVIGIAILAMGIFSCTDSNVRVQLQRIEKMMDGNPNADSAMTLLKAIDFNTLSSEKDRAYYAVLMSQAKAKTGEFVSDDSLISIAVNYYSRNDDTYYYMLSQYYLGRAKHHAQNYSQSIVAMFKALECATELDNKFWMGLICQSLAETYNDTFNAAEELVYAEKAYQYFKESGKQPYINYAILDKANASINNGGNDIAISLLKQCIDSATKYKDEYLLVSSKRFIGLCYLSNDKYSEALSIYQDVTTTHFANVNDSAYLSFAYLKCGHVSHAFAITNSLSECEEPLNSLLKSEIYAKQDSIEKAFNTFKHSEHIATENIEKKMSMNIIGSTLDYFKLSKETAEANAQRANIILFFLSVITLLILIIIAFGVYCYRKKQHTKIEQNVIAAEQLREALVEKEAQYDGVRESLKELVSSKYDFFDEMCRLVYESNNTVAARKRISDSVTSLIKKMQNDPNMIKSMENIVDRHCSGLMSDLRMILPDMQDAYYRLFLFSVLGFSDTTISMLLNKEKVSHVYNIRRHLKDKIKDLDAENRDRFIKWI